MCQILEEMCREADRLWCLKLARKMIAAGEPIEKIMRYSDLSEEEVRELMGDAENCGRVSETTSPQGKPADELRAAVCEEKTSKGGVKEMCQIMEDLRRETIQKVRQETDKARKLEIARRMVAAGEPVEKIVRYSDLSEAEVRALMGAAENCKRGSGTA